MTFLKCPHCGYEPEYGVHVCQGCQSEIVYGVTPAVIILGGCAMVLLGAMILPFCVIIPFIGTGILNTMSSNPILLGSLAVILFVYGCRVQYNRRKTITFHRYRR